MIKLKSNFYRSLIQLLSSSAIAQLFTIGVSFLLTRIYNVEEIAFYSIILTFVSLFGPVICAKLDSAIVIANSDDEAINLSWGSLYISSIISVTAFIIYLIYIKLIEEYSSLVNYSVLLLVLLMLNAVVNILISINNRNNDYRLISKLQVRRSLVQNIGIIIFGLLKFGVNGLIFSQQLSLLIGIKLQLKNIDAKYYLKVPKAKEIIISVKKYKEQLIFTLPAHFLNSASYSLLNLFIMSLFGAITFGYYSMTFRILSLPLSLISMNVSKIFLRRASELSSQGDSTYPFFKKVSSFLILVAIPMVLVLLFFAPDLFSILLGNEWEIAGFYAQILAPMYGIRLVVSALTPILLITKNQKIELYIQCLFLLIALIAYGIVSVFALNVTSYLYIISVSYSIIYIIFYVILFINSKKVGEEIK